MAALRQISVYILYVEKTVFQTKSPMCFSPQFNQPNELCAEFLFAIVSDFNLKLYISGSDSTCSHYYKRTAKFNFNLLFFLLCVVVAGFCLRG